MESLAGIGVKKALAVARSIAANHAGESASAATASHTPAPTQHASALSAADAAAPMPDAAPVAALTTLMDALADATPDVDRVTSAYSAARSLSQNANALLALPGFAFLTFLLQQACLHSLHTAAAVPTGTNAGADEHVDADAHVHTHVNATGTDSRDAAASAHGSTLTIPVPTPTPTPVCAPTPTSTPARTPPHPTPTPPDHAPHVPNCSPFWKGLVYTSDWMRAAYECVRAPGHAKEMYKLFADGLGHAEMQVRLVSVQAIEWLIRADPGMFTEVAESLLGRSGADITPGAHVDEPASGVVARVDELVDGAAAGADRAAAAFDPQGAAWRRVEANILALAACITGGAAAVRAGANGAAEPSNASIDAVADICTLVLRGVLVPQVQSEVSYVREACVHGAATIASQTMDTADGLSSLPPDVRSKLMSSVSRELLLPCLSDVKPQVRMAACVLLRLLIAHHPSCLQEQLPQIVPPICLLRYYGTERQRYFFQETWRRLVAPAADERAVCGPDIVASLVARRASRRERALASLTPEWVAEATATVSVSVSSVPSASRVDPRTPSGPEPSSVDGPSAARAARSSSPMRAHSISATFTETAVQSPSVETRGASRRSRSPDAAGAPSPSKSAPHIAIASPLRALPAATPLEPQSSESLQSLLGPLLVEAFFDETLDYYLQQVRTPHIMAQEAAALCMGEAVGKIDHVLVSQRAPDMLDSLCSTLGDGGDADSWPAVDAAVVTVSRLCSSFPARLGVEGMRKAVAFLFGQLEFPNKMARDHAAEALGTLATHDPAVLSRLQEYAASGLCAFREARRSGAVSDIPNVDDSPTLTNVVSVSRDSIAADGAMYALRELAKLAPAEAEKLLPLAAETFSDAAARPALQENFCRQVAEIMSRLGKNALKRNLELFLPVLCDMVSGKDAVVRSRAWAAGDCIAQFRRTLGPTIFAARLTPEQASALARSGCIPGLM